MPHQPTGASAATSSLRRLSRGPAAYISPLPQRDALRSSAATCGQKRRCGHPARAQALQGPCHSHTQGPRRGLLSLGASLKRRPLAHIFRGRPSRGWTGFDRLERFLNRRQALIERPVRPSRGCRLGAQCANRYTRPMSGAIRPMLVDDHVLARRGVFRSDMICFVPCFTRPLYRFHDGTIRPAAPPPRVV
jgi:hypothetical protein